MRARTFRFKMTLSSLAVLNLAGLLKVVASASELAVYD
jgi:hypothetical protein